MHIEYPEYYNKFHCLAGDCPDTCCKDWEVDVDEDTFRRESLERSWSSASWRTET